MMRRRGTPMAWRRLAAFGLAFTIGGPAASLASPGEGALTVVAGATATTVEATLDRYCVTCHNARVLEGRGTAPSMLVSQLREIGLAFDSLDLADLGDHADVWERVVRKLESRTMPPVGRPRPDEETYESVRAWLETELDRVAAEAPNPGRRPALHRLSRTEYRNAVRDLLALDDLPKEFDVSTLLPADNATSGFDNLAELLFVSPATLERYLAAARKISRLAVGDTTLPPIVDRYQLDRDLIQDRHLDGLPLGTRGGALIRSHLPADGEYIVTVEFAQAARAEHEVEVSVDGERVALFTIGGRPLAPRRERGLRVRGRAARRRPRTRSAPARGRSRSRFLRRTGAQHEGLVRASRRGQRREPAIATVTLSGPYGVDGAGRHPEPPPHPHLRAETPGRTPAPCAREILSTLVRRAYRRPVTEADSRRPAAVLRRRRGAGRLRARHSARARADAGQPRVPVPHRAGPGGRGALARRTASATWSWHRACRSSSGAAFRTTSCSTGPPPASSASRRCSRRRCVACWPTTGRGPSSTTSPSSGSTCGTSRRRSPIPGFFPGLRREPAPGVHARDGPVHRQRAPRGPRRQRAADGRLHLPQRAPREALRHSLTSMAATSAASRSPAAERRGLLGQGGILTLDVVRDAHLARAARQVDPREPAGLAAAPAAPGHPGPGGDDGRRRRALDARRDGAAPRQPGLRELSRADGSARLRPRELRRRGPLAGAGRVERADRRQRRPA